jgi:hypothetical protein
VAGVRIPVVRPMPAEPNPLLGSRFPPAEPVKPQSVFGT